MHDYHTPETKQKWFTVVQYKITDVISKEDVKSDDKLADVLKGLCAEATQPTQGQVAGELLGKSVTSLLDDLVADGCGKDKWSGVMWSLKDAV